MGMIVKWILFSIAIYYSAELIPGIRLDDFYSALIAAIGLGLLNAVVRPILMILTLPLSVLTLGLFSFVINALMVMAATYFIPGFFVDGFLDALIFSLVVSVISGLLNAIFDK